MGPDTPWTTGDVLFTAELLRAIEDHCRAGYPKEACGFVLGPIGDPRSLTFLQEAANAQDEYRARFPDEFVRTARTAYVIEPKAIIGAFTLAKEREEAVKVIYHSHVDGEAHFSEDDRMAALLGDEPAYAVSFLVVSVVDGVVRDRKLYAWEPGKHDFVEVPVRVAG